MEDSHEYETKKSLCEKYKLQWVAAFLICSLINVNLYLMLGYIINTSAVTKKPLSLEFQPQLSSENSLIRVRMKDSSSYTKWIDILKEFTQAYRDPVYTPGRRDRLVNCSYDDPVPEDKVCDYNIDSWAPCSLNNDFSYHKRSLCVFLRLNKDRNFKMEYFHNLAELPEDMPLELKEYIEKFIVDEPDKINTVWTYCEGVTNLDKGNISQIAHFPMNGFPGYLFDNDKREGYVRPIIAVVFKKLHVNVVINVKCRFWTRNYSDHVTFQFYIKK